MNYPQAYIVAFRGTANFRDGLSDGQCWRHDHIHAGFAVAFNSVAIELSDYLDKLADKPIFFTGHSLGGAQAVLAATNFFRRTTQLYTFGQPRVGDRRFASMSSVRLAGKHFRIVNQEDIVPRLPCWILGYRHSGQEWFFPSTGGGLKLGAPLWMKLTSDLYGAWIDFTKNNAVAQLADHHIEGYIDLLEKL